MKVFAVVAAAVCACCALPAAGEQWTLIRSSHFHVYSQAGEREGRSIALWLEQLRAFFVACAPNAAGSLERHGPVKVVQFRSAREYGEVQPRPAADAFFLGTEAADYIVMPHSGSAGYQIAAHEYAHLVLHSLGIRVAPWFSEGLSELFSTLRLNENRWFIGGDLPARHLTLRQQPWIPLARLLDMNPDAAMPVDRKQISLFYAESWAFVDMLLFSRNYAAQASKLGNLLESGTGASQDIAKLYGKTLRALTEDLRAWVENPRIEVPLPAVHNGSEQIRATVLTGFESRMMMAELLLAGGQLNRAETLYRTLAAERPNDPTAPAALGTIALRKGTIAEARKQWKVAVELGVRDATLCYRYALLAEDAAVPVEDVREALQRVVEMDPTFDDARYRLGLLESREAHYDAALEQFRAMRSVSPGRAYAYWTAVSSALTAIDRREEAKSAAYEALSHATSAEERESARRLAYVAVTDLTVQVTHDSNGNLQMVTARKPHGSDAWNPFVEPGDDMRSLSGQIRAVECASGRITGFQIQGTSGTIKLALADPSHVLIVGGTPEFVCGADDGRKVIVEYAAARKQDEVAGTLRGMRFQ